MMFGTKLSLGLDSAETLGSLFESIDEKVEFEALLDSLREHLQGVVVCLSHSWGGLEKVAAGDALDVGALGVRLQVACLQGSPIHQYLADRKEVSLFPLDYRPRNYFDFNFRKDLHHLMEEGVNLFHLHQPSLLGTVVPWMWDQSNVALLVTRHIMNNHNKKDFVHRALYRRVDAMVVMSQALKRNVVETHPIRERELKVVNLGLDFDVYDPERVNPLEQRNTWGAGPDTIVIGLVGRIDPAKGQATFIKAAAGLLKGEANSSKLKFVIVGEDTLGEGADHLSELKEMVTQFRLEDLVVFAGYQENIPEVMRAFDICVMPSRQEAFGLVAIEAMAMECPIIISSGGSAEEIVGNEEFGLMVRPDDAFDLRQRIRYLLDHPIERVQMGKKARKHVVANYNRKTRLLKTLSLYHRTLRRRRVI